MREPLVHVLVINWNGLEHLEECFSRLLAGGYANARFVLIDNGSTDGSEDYVRAHFGHDPRVEILRLEENQGWAGANNRGIERALVAGAQYIILLNNDTAVERGFIHALVDMAESHPEAGALAAKMLLYDHPELLNSLGIACSIAGFGWDRGLGRVDGPAWEACGAVASACGGACLYRATTLRETGLLPEDFGMYGDDLELGLRIWAAGCTVLTCPQARVRHKFSATMGAGKPAERKLFLGARNRFLLVLRLWPLGLLLRAIPAFFIAELGSLRAAGGPSHAAIAGGEHAKGPSRWTKAAIRVRAWAAALVYIPKALVARWEWRQRGLDLRRIAAHVQCRPVRFPGVPLPNAEGWYPPEQCAGNAMRPFAAKARIAAPGRLRVSLRNCYPQAGSACVEIQRGGARLAVLESDGVADAIVEAGDAPLDITARRIFSPEETGAPFDIGGWMTWEPVAPETAEREGN